MDRRSSKLKKSHEYEINGYHITVVVDARDPQAYAQAHIRPLQGSAQVDAVTAHAMLTAIKESLVA